jgi:hypothetical protein
VQQAIEYGTHSRAPVVMGIEEQAIIEGSQRLETILLVPGRTRKSNKRRAMSGADEAAPLKRVYTLAYAGIVK